MYTVESCENEDGICRITVSKNSASDSSGHMMYIACYKGGVMTKLVAEDISSLAEGKKEYTAECVNADSIKVFFWKGTEPVSSSVEL